MKNFFKKHFTKKRIIAFFILRKIIAAILIFSFITPPSNVQAQAAPAANFVINRVIAGSVTKNVLRRGFAANDPRYAKTLEAISGNVTALNVVSTSAGMALTIAGAPVWLTIAASLGVFALGAYIFADKSKITVTPSGIKYDPAQSPVNPYVPTYPAVSQPETYLQKYVLNGAQMYQGKGCFPSQLCAALPKFPSTLDPLIKIEIPSQSIEGSPFGSGDSVVVFDSLEQLATGLVINARPPYLSNQAVWSPFNTSGKVVTFFDPASRFITHFSFQWIVPPYIDTAPNGSKRIVARYSSSKTCPHIDDYCAVGDRGSAWYNPSQDWSSDDVVWPVGLAAKLHYVISKEGAPSTYQDLDTFNDQLSPYQRAQPLTNASIARLADAAWADAASKPGYLGVPYTNMEPVTENDVEQYLVNHVRPTIGDLMRPAATGADAVPIGEVGTGSGTSTGVLIKDVNVVNVPEVKIINKVKLDFGDAPNTPQPNDWSVGSFESAFATFMDPIFRFRDPLVGVAHGGQCPRPSIEIFGKTIVLDGHCFLITEYAFTIAVALTAAYAYFALTILLSA
nr:hypothetical protein [uncultured Undibacterium sp.]